MKISKLMASNIAAATLFAVGALISGSASAFDVQVVAYGSGCSRLYLDNGQVIELKNAQSYTIKDAIVFNPNGTAHPYIASNFKHACGGRAESSRTFYAGGRKEVVTLNN